MSTYGEIQDRISQDYLNRSDYGAEVRRAILAAVRYYERRRWRFNETASSLTTSAGQSYLTLPSNFLVLDKLKITYSGSTNNLDRQDLDYILDMRDNASQGVPTDFTIRAQKIELAVVPDSAYACPLYYIKSLSALSASTDSNAWTTGIMEDVIVYHATKLMWANVIRNDQEAAKYKALEDQAVAIASSDLEQYTISTLKPTRF